MILATLAFIVAGACLVATIVGVRQTRTPWALGLVAALMLGAHWQAEASIADQRAIENALCTGRGGWAMTSMAKGTPDRVTCGNGRTYTLSN